MIRVLLVDDSPIAIAVIRKMLATSSDVLVVGSASNGKEALQIIPSLKPDVVCTDLHMPKMDGLELTREIMSRHPLPILVISISVQGDDNHNCFELLEAGAIELFPKPRDGLHKAGEQLTRELVQKIKILSGVVPIRRHQRKETSQPSKKTSSTPTNPLPFNTRQIGKKRAIVAIGASTGGPQALTTIFGQLPSNFPLPVVCVQHISIGFLEELIDWLKQHTTLPVHIAQQGEHPQPGHIYLPPEDTHLLINKDGSFLPQKMVTGLKSHISHSHHHRPSIDITFHSIAESFGSKSIGILLTGMGRDGAEGMRSIVLQGGETIAQDEASSVIFGMPKQAISLGGAKQIKPIGSIAQCLLKLVAANGR
ncbi:chemotaxis-specific protein-glutamate methyltransferase CheB [Magnetococcales bacterium HHB-1]